jgi:ABC-type cobalt transport system substrate-binding protein
LIVILDNILIGFEFVKNTRKAVYFGACRHSINQIMKINNGYNNPFFQNVCTFFF